MTHPSTTPTPDEAMPAVASPDEAMMRVALRCAESARLVSRPNPWVGAVVVARDGRQFTGATRPVGEAHAEIVALEAAGDAAAGSTLYCTLEPCSHTGRTGPCAQAIIDAGVSRVVIGVEDPDARVSGRGVDMLRHAGITVDVGVCAPEVTELLTPYLHHRRTGRPWVVLKMATTLDGRVAAVDGSSQWITGPDARRRVHRLRAESDAICVGAGTVRADDPSLTTREVEGPSPRRVVLGSVPESARVHPCLEWTGPIDDLLDRLGDDGVIQLLVEGGPRVARSFHEQRLIDRYVFHLAPALSGGGDAPPVFAGSAAATIDDMWRGRIESVTRLGDDVEIVVLPSTATNQRSTTDTTRNN
jgi:diaminohydroxyphosphoribosylaminopyrimidine deaminase/5-amino-6-(5-phosphoribosylamino)uracil reductase